MSNNSIEFDIVKAEAVIKQLFSNIAGMKFGSTSVSVVVHDGRVVELSYTKTDKTRDIELSNMLSGN
jgi:hypothetical protein